MPTMGRAGVMGMGGRDREVVAPPKGYTAPFLPPSQYPVSWTGASVAAPAAGGRPRRAGEITPTAPKRPTRPSAAAAARARAKDRAPASERRARRLNRQRPWGPIPAEV